MLAITFVLSAIIALSSASPVELVSQESHVMTPTVIPLNKRSTFAAGGEGTVDIDAVHKHRTMRSAKIHHTFTTYEANTGKIHPLANSTTKSKRDSQKVALQDDSSKLWQGVISIGTPPQNFTVDFDTGSTDIFIANPWCNYNCDGHNVYHAEHSSSAHALFRPFRLQYADGSSVYGLQYSETVSIANMIAVNQTIGSAFLYSDGFGIDQFPADGLMGLAYPSISVYHAPSLMHTLVSQNKTNDTVFAFKMAQTGSELSIGGVNDAMYKGNFTYMNVTEQGFWQIEMDALTVEGTQTVGNKSVIIDTGTTLIIASTADAHSIYATIPGAKELPDQPGMYSVPCGTSPIITMTFGGKPFMLSHETFSMGMIANSTTECLGGIVGQDGQDFWIVGDVFLRNVYASFDVGKNRVGFADLA